MTNSDNEHQLGKKKASVLIQTANISTTNIPTKLARPRAAGGNGKGVKSPATVMEYTTAFARGVKIILLASLTGGKIDLCDFGCAGFQSG